MKKYKPKAIVLFLFVTKYVFASYLSMGNRALSLGGAYTAVSGNVYALYNNPAGLYSGYNTDFKLDLLVNTNFTGDILYNVNQILETSETINQISQLQQSGGEIDIVQITTLFKSIKNLMEMNQPSKGILFKLNGGFGIKVKNFAFGIRNVTDFSAKPYIDTSFSLRVDTTTYEYIYFAPYTFSSKTLKLAQSNIPVFITTATLKYENLTQIRNNLKYNVLPWLINELKKIGVEISPEIENDLEGIANNLINLAKDKGVSDDEVISSVNTLEDPDFQNFISNFLENSLNRTTRLSENQSSLDFKVVNYTELSFAYSHQIINDLCVGGAFRTLFGKSIYYSLKIFQQEDNSNSGDAMSFDRILSSQYTKNVAGFGLDLGAIYKLPIPLPFLETKTGLVIKNLIEPQFDFAGTNKKYKLPRQLTLGVSATAIKIFTLNIDCDLNKVPTLVDGYNVQNLSLGLEINPPYVPYIRFGYLTNLAISGDQLYTLGLGIKIWKLNFDLTGAFNPKETKISKDFTLPTSNLVLGLTFGFNF